MHRIDWEPPLFLARVGRETIVKQLVERNDTGTSSKGAFDRFNDG